MLERVLEISCLFDLYGALLTDKQRRCLELHFMCDLSLTEIADELGVSRQAIYDIIHRSEQVLMEYEAKLGLLARQQRDKKELAAVLSLLEAVSSEASELREAKRKLSGLVGERSGGTL